MLADYAVRVEDSRGRRHPEPPHPYRNDFQRDRDRVVHARAFRRLEAKTQVFTRRYSDHFRNRLTHTIEVAQISRTIATQLGLNTDLVEALALAHAWFWENQIDLPDSLKGIDLHDMDPSEKKGSDLTSAEKAVPKRTPAMDRPTLVRTLTDLTPADFARLIAMIPGAARQLSRVSVPEQAGELIRWAESSKGPGLAAIEEALATFR